MPLPANDIAWPPYVPEVQTALQDWSAWYSGDPDKLAEQYLYRATRVHLYRPSQYRGGISGRFARWWWGEPVSYGEKRAKLHVPLAGDIARASSDLLFSEPPKITVTDTATQDRINDLVQGGLHATLLESGEVSAALGGNYLRIVWDTNVRDRPWISPVHADAAIPDFSFGVLTAVTFWTVIERQGAQVIRHLERHERGQILHGVYVGTDMNLGSAKPLTSFPATKNYTPVVATGAPKNLTAAYIPNMRPARAWREIPSAAYWGASDFQGTEGLMDQLDETYSSWMRDIRLAKARIIVPSGYLQSRGPGHGAAFDENREVYSELAIAPTDNQGLTLTQFAIRHVEHKATADSLVEQIVRMAGYSTATFGEPDGAALTATEVRANQSRTMSTRGRKILYNTPGLADITESLLAVEAGPLFNSRVQVERPVIEWQDSISEAPLDLAQTALALDQAHAASTETRVRLVHPDWDDQRVTAEVSAILAENGMAVSDPTMLGVGGFGL